ncbi:MAG: hypothetical protein ACKPCM_10055 [Pseudanabaena sp.]
MLTLEKMTQAETLADAQLNAIKTRAIALWGDKWLARLAEKYKEVAGLETQADSTVRRWFKQGSNVKPSLESFNNLLLATGCQMVIEAPEQIIKAQRIL